MIRTVMESLATLIKMFCCGWKNYILNNTKFFKNDYYIYQHHINEEVNFSKVASKYFSPNSETMDNIHNESKIIIFKTTLQLIPKKESNMDTIAERKKKKICQIKFQFKQ